MIHPVVSACVAVAAVFALGGCTSAPASSGAAPPMPTVAAPADPTCLLIVQGVVTDREAFRAYAAALPPLYERFGGSYLVVARNPEVMEGEPPFESLVISRWPSCDAARAFWWSPDYRRLAEMRRDWGRFDVVIAPEMPSGVTAAPMARPPAPTR